MDAVKFCKNSVLRAGFKLPSLELELQSGVNVYEALSRVYKRWHVKANGSVFNKELNRNELIQSIAYLTLYGVDLSVLVLKCPVCDVEFLKEERGCKNCPYCGETYRLS